MITTLMPLIELVLAQAAIYGGVFLRVGAMISVAPAFGSQSLPARLRLAGALAFTVIVAPLVPVTPILGAGALAGLVVIETCTGLFFGLLLRFFIHALQVAGTIAAQSTSLSQMFGGAQMDAQPVLSALLVWSGLTLAVITELHLKLVSYVLVSYELQPYGVLISAQNVAQLGVGTIAHSFALGFAIAAPFLAGSLIYNVTLGFINKAMPQLMVSFIGAPAVTFAGLILFGIGGALLLEHWLTVFWAFVADPGLPR